MPQHPLHLINEFLLMQLFMLRTPPCDVTVESLQQNAPQLFMQASPACAFAAQLTSDLSANVMCVSECRAVSVRVLHFWSLVIAPFADAGATACISYSVGHLRWRGLFRLPRWYRRDDRFFRSIHLCMLEVIHLYILASRPRATTGIKGGMIVSLIQCLFPTRISPLIFIIQIFLQLFTHARA